MAKLTHGGRSIYGAPHSRNEKRRYFTVTGRHWPDYRSGVQKKATQSYADRSGPVFVVEEGNVPLVGQVRYAFGKLRRKVLRRDRSSCRYCGSALTSQTAVVDHVHPFEHGGRTLLSNLVACCTFCNKAKMNRLGVDAPPIGSPTNPFGNAAV